MQGFAPEVSWTLLAEGAYAVRAGLPWIASNLDATVPTPRGIAPGNGALVDLVARVTGRRPDAVAGKPETPLHEEAVRRTGARDPLVVGDRLDTDIEGAVRAGVPSLLVLTGVAQPADLLTATEQSRPTYVARGLADGLLEPHPAVRSDASDTWTCGGWTARRLPDDLELTGDGDPLDGLRAAAVAAWAGEPLPERAGRAGGGPAGSLTRPSAQSIERSLSRSRTPASTLTRPASQAWPKLRSPAVSATRSSLDAVIRIWARGAGSVVMSTMRPSSADRRR